MRAMIMAAGFGTRLGELSGRRPKPMLPVCGAPLVRWAALWLRAQGIREIVINLHHHGEQIEAELGDGAGLGLAIAYSREAEILGTGGGLRQARDLLDDGSGAPIVAMNGKVILDLELAPVLARHRERGAEATMVLREDPGGNVRCTADGVITHLRDRQAAAVAGAGPACMFTGVQIVTPRFLDRIPKAGQQCVVSTAYLELLRSGAPLHAHVTREYWWEHSTAPRYLQGVANVIEGRARLAYAPGPLRGVDPSAEIDASATIDALAWIGPRVRIGAGALVGPRVQLGADVVVAPGVRLRDVIAWDGVHVVADAEHTVLVA